MTSDMRRLRRRQLDRLFEKTRPLANQVAPKGGWLKEVREALGMSLETFGKRLGIGRAAAYKVELAEETGSISLKRLKIAANALDCDVFVAIVPRTSLVEMVERRALEIARERIDRVGHTMDLEGQEISSDEIQELVKTASAEILRKGEQKLWR